MCSYANKNLVYIHVYGCVQFGGAYRCASWKGLKYGLLAFR